MLKFLNLTLEEQCEYLIKGVVSIITPSLKGPETVTNHISTKYFISESFLKSNIEDFLLCCLKVYIHFYANTSCRLGMKVLRQACYLLFANSQSFTYNLQKVFY